MASQDLFDSVNNYSPYSCTFERPLGPLTLNTYDFVLLNASAVNVPTGAIYQIPPASWALGANSAGNKGNLPVDTTNPGYLQILPKTADTVYFCSFELIVTTATPLAAAQTYSIYVQQGAGVTPTDNAFTTRMQTGTFTTLVGQSSGVDDSLYYGICLNFRTKLGDINPVTNPNGKLAFRVGVSHNYPTAVSFILLARIVPDYKGE
jgi:hypothetical protein